MIKPAKMWYLKIRAVEKDRYNKAKLAHNASARRISYQVAVSVKFAIQENNVRVVNSWLGMSNDSIIGFTKADPRVPMLSLAEIYVSP